MQRLLSFHGFTSLIECDSYLRRYYQYSSGFPSTMSCPYAYKKSLQLCKVWALATCTNISPRERNWLHSSRTKRSTPWACDAGVLGIPKFFFTSFGGSCDSNNMLAFVHIFFDLASSLHTTRDLIKTVKGKTVSLAKISDKLTTKVNNLQSVLRTVEANFHEWQSKLLTFSVKDSCHFNNFMEFLSKFSLEITRTFSTLLRFIEINDVIHQVHKLHDKQLVGFDDLPSFLSTEIQLRLKAIPSLRDTVFALDSGFPLLLQPLIDYRYQNSKALSLNILFTVPELPSTSPFCTIEYLLPIKYNISGTCYQGPITRDELTLLHCGNSDYVLHKSILDKCYQSDDTFVCPQNILHLANGTGWLGFPWHKNSKLTFTRRHTQAPDCTNLHVFYHLGGRYYLSTQQGSLKVHNTSNGSSHIIPLSPLMVYHFPCELTFPEQPQGLGNCPDRVAFHIPIFTKTTLHYIPWVNHDSNILEIHYRSLNLTPPLHFDNSTLKSLDNTYRLLDGRLTTQLTSLQHDISKIHTETTSSTHTWLLYSAFALTLLNTLFISLLCCRISRPILFQSLPQVFSARKQHASHSSTTKLSKQRSRIKQTELEREIESEPVLSSTELPNISMCSTCNKPVTT